MNGKENKRKRLSLAHILIILLFLAVMGVGVFLMFTPFLENYEHQKEVKQEVTAFNELVAIYRTEQISQNSPDNSANTSKPYADLYNAMYSYNLEIYKNGQSKLVDAWSYQSDVFDLDDYGYGVNSVGLVKIPDIAVELPLFLGASYENLANGFAQLSQTSMPIGGENTNCVIAGHRGWNGMAYMRDVELLEIGDSVFLENPWETLEYRISEIILIEPSNVESVYIKEGRDLLTIITCHPYGVGSHRYVLICDRYTEETDVKAPEIRGRWVWEWQSRVNVTATENIEFESSQALIFVSEYLPWLILMASAALLILLLLILSLRHIIQKRRYYSMSPATEASNAPEDVPVEPSQDISLSDI